MRTTLRFFGPPRDSAYGTLRAIYAMPILYLVLHRYFRNLSGLKALVALVLLASLLGMAYSQDTVSAIGYGAVLGFVWSGILVLLASAPRHLWIIGTLGTAVASLFTHKISEWIHPIYLDKVRFPARANTMLHLVELLYFGFFIYVYVRIGM